MSRRLVCEGRCNKGNVQAFDTALERARDRDALSESWLMVARRFLYTHHVAVSEYEYQCSSCGTTRRYGGQRRGVPVLAEGAPDFHQQVTDLSEMALAALQAPGQEAGQDEPKQQRRR